MEDKKNNPTRQNKSPETAGSDGASARARDKMSDTESTTDEKSHLTEHPRSKGSSAKPETVADADPAAAVTDSINLDIILGIPMEITVELGRTNMPIRELLSLGPGSAVALSRLEGEPLDILANNTLIARGIVVVKNDRYGIRITEITSRLNRIESLR